MPRNCLSRLIIYLLKAARLYWTGNIELPKKVETAFQVSTLPSTYYDARSSYRVPIPLCDWRSGVTPPAHTRTYIHTRTQDISNEVIFGTQASTDTLLSINE